MISDDAWTNMLYTALFTVRSPTELELRETQATWMAWLPCQSGVRRIAYARVRVPDEEHRDNICDSE